MPGVNYTSFISLSCSTMSVPRQWRGKTEDFNSTDLAFQSLLKNISDK